MDLTASTPQGTAFCVLHNRAKGRIDSWLSSGSLCDLMQVVLLEKAFHGANLPMSKVEGCHTSLLRLQDSTSSRCLEPHLELSHGTQGHRDNPRVLELASEQWLVVRVPSHLMIAVLVEVQVDAVWKHGVLVLVIEIEATEPTLGHLQEPIRKGHCIDLLLAVTVRAPTTFFDEPHGLPGDSSSAMDFDPIHLFLDLIEIVMRHMLLLAHVHPGA